MSEMNDGGHEAKKQPTGDYEVGYCRPPTASRWKPGESGNRRGRRKQPNKRHQDIIRILRDELIAEISAIEGGSEVKIGMLRFLAKQLVADFAKGTPPQRLRLFKELLSLGVLQPGYEDHQTDGEAVNKFLEQLAAETGLVRGADGNYIDPNAASQGP